MTGGLFASPPINDSYAARTVLTMSGASGSNVEATTEAGEPKQLTDALPSGTVWWSFAPPAPGWYEISTAGSSFDTVLSLYRGADWSSLVRVASADDDVLDDSTGTSRIRFQAAAGETFSLQAGSYNNAIRGSVAVSVQSVAEPAERVTSLNLNPGGPYDVSAAAQNVTLSFGLQLASALDYGTVHLARPDGTLLREWEFSSAQRTSGTALAGNYQMSVTLPRYAASGHYPLWITAVTVNPAAPVVENGAWAWTSFPAAATPYFALSNSGTADTTAPALVTASFAPASVDVTTAGAVVPLTLRITDNLSGFVSGAVSLEQTVNATQTDVLAAGALAAANRTTGTSADGHYVVQFFIPQNAPAGIWQLRGSLTDSLGNSAAINSSATLTVNKNPWPAWVQAQALTGVDAGPAADPDQDGIPNLQEFAFHTDPKRADLTRISPLVPERVYRFRGAMPYEYLSGGEWRLRYIRRRGANAGPVTTVPLFGSDLTGWTPATDLTVTPFSADWEMVEARDPAGAGIRRFARILVTLP